METRNHNIWLPLFMPKSELSQKFDRPYAMTGESLEFYMPSRMSTLE